MTIHATTTTWLSKPHAFSGANPFNEYNSRSLQSGFYGEHSFLGNVSSIPFKVDDGRKPQSCALGQCGLVHFQQRASGSRLGRS